MAPPLKSPNGPSPQLPLAIRRELGTMEETMHFHGTARCGVNKNMQKDFDPQKAEQRFLLLF